MLIGCWLGCYYANLNIKKFIRDFWTVRSPPFYLFSYIKHVDVLIRQRLWFNSLDFKRLRFKNSAIMILCGNELAYIVLKSVFSYLYTRYTDFLLTIFYMNVAIKENFPKLPYLIFDFLIDHNFFPFFKYHLRLWMDWMIFFKCHS